MQLTLGLRLLRLQALEPLSVFTNAVDPFPSVVDKQGCAKQRGSPCERHPPCTAIHVQ